MFGFGGAKGDSGAAARLEEDMDIAGSLLLQQVLVAHQQLEERLAAKMESHQRSLLETMQQGWDRCASNSPRARRPESRQSTNNSRAASRSKGRLSRGSSGCSDASDAEGGPAGCLEGGGGDEAELASNAGVMAPPATDEELQSEGGDDSLYDDRSSPAVFGEPCTPAVPLDGIQNQLADNRNSILKSGHAAGGGSGLAVRARRLAGSWWFEMFIAVSITMNAVSIGWNTDWSMKNPGEKRPLQFVVLDWSFLAIFMFELLLRIIGEGRGFCDYSSKMFGWNMFDSLIILLTLLNEVNILNVQMSVVRVFRVLRLVYVVRMVRLMRGFRELRMMVSGIMNCGKTLLWSGFLLIVITYIYAVVCLQISAEWLSETTVGSEVLSAENHGTAMFLQANFPSLNWSIYTLFKVVSGGVSWGEISDPLERVSIFLISSFPLFIVVTIFCALNVITAAFVEAASRTAQEEDANALEHIEERKRWIEDISKIFIRHDRDHCGSLDWNEFQTILLDWRTQAAFKDIGIDLSYQKANSLFTLFDLDGDGRVDINEFAQGMHHLRGNARSLDMFRSFLKMERALDRVLRRLALGDDEQQRSLCRMASRVSFDSSHSGVPAHPRRMGSSLL